VNTPVTSHYVDVTDRPWTERRPGVFWKVLWEDGDRKALLVRYAAGATIPRHRHLGDEQVFVLEGSVSDDTGTCTAGNYVRRPPGCVHAVRSDSGAIVLAILSGATQPLPSDDRAQ
jgi:anti-sigma factor ChrR (cupin superfamily)